MAAITKFVIDADHYQKEKPYIFDGPEMGFPATNCAMKEQVLPLTDLRTVPDFKPNMEEHGFTFVEQKSETLPFLTGDHDSQPYADEIAELLKKVLGAEIVIPTNTRLRSADKTHLKTPPGCEAHIDMTPYDAWGRMVTMLTREEQDLVLSGKYRARFINVWRPMINHAEDFPLAVLDPNSIEDITDVIAVDRVSPLGSVELCYMRYNPNHKWYWLSNMTPDEVVIFTQHDTHPRDGKFTGIGHTAFRNEAARPRCPPRQSVEARFICLEPAPYQAPVTIADPHPAEMRKQVWAEHLTLPPKPKFPPANAKDRKMAFGTKPQAPPAAQAIKTQ